MVSNVVDNGDVSTIQRGEITLQRLANIHTQLLSMKPVHAVTVQIIMVMMEYL